MANIMMFQPPSPPYSDVNRDYAGGFGVAVRTDRKSYGHTGGSFELMPNCSLMYSTSILEQEGHSVTFLDGQPDNLNLKKVLREIGLRRPEIIVSVINLPSIYGDIDLLEKVKNDFPNIKIICVGTVCKALDKLILKNGTIDCIIQGEAEAVIANLIDRMVKEESVNDVKGIAFLKNDRVMHTPSQPIIEDLDSLPFPAFHLMPMEKYKRGFYGQMYRYSPIWSSRGCPFKCSYYCPYPYYFGKKVRYRSPNNVVDEIELLVNNFGVEALLFRDQTFSIDMKRAEEICDLIIQRKLELKWLCETRVDKVSKNLLRKMKKAGCESIHFGMETGDPDLLFKVGKPGIDINTFKNTIKMTKKQGIKAAVHVIVGLPGETRNTIENSLRMLFETRPDNAFFNVITPYPGTKLFNEAKEKNWISTTDWSKFTGMDPVMRTENFTVEELKEVQKNLDEKFRHGAPFNIRLERMVRGFTTHRNKKEKIMKFIQKKMA